MSGSIVDRQRVPDDARPAAAGHGRAGGGATVTSAYGGAGGRRVAQADGAGPVGAQPAPPTRAGAFPADDPFGFHLLGPARAGGADAAGDLGLPAGVDYEHVPGTMKVRVRTAWLTAGDPVARNLTLLEHLRDRGALAWATPAQLAAAARAIHLSPDDAHAEVTTISYPATVYAFVGLPPGVAASASVQRDGRQREALTLAIAAADVDLPTGTKLPLTPVQVGAVVAALEDFTHLAVRPATRARLAEVTFTGKAGPGVFVVRFTREDLDALFGAEAVQAWLDDHRGGAGADARAVGPDAGGLTADELATIKAWLAANVPHGADGGAVIDRTLRAIITEIDASPYRSQILAALAVGRGGGSVTTAGLRSLVNAVAFEAQVQTAGVALPGQAGHLPPVWPVPVPARIDQLGGRIVGGERVPFRVLVDVPVELLTPERQDELRLRPFTTAVAWVFEKTAGAPGVVDTALGRAHGAKVTLHHQYRGLDEHPISMAFALAPQERAATWTATAFVRHSHFEPAVVATELQVRAEDDLLQELEQQASGDMGVADAASGPFDFDTGLLNNHFGADGTDLGTAFYGLLPDDWRAPTPAERGAQRTRQMVDLRSMIGYLRERDEGGGNQAAIDAAQQYLARLQRADHAVAHDQDEGWQPFEIRGTFLSRAPGVADGPLDLVGMVMRVRRTVRPAAHVRDPIGGENEGHTVERVSIALRDLTRRFDADDRRVTGEGATFEAALEAAFVTLCKSYPAGQVFVQAQVHGPDLAATQHTVGFELDTGTVGKRVKAAVFDPLVNAAVNLAGMAAMIFVPGSATIVMPTLIAYNTAQTADQLHTAWVEGTLTARELALGLTSVGLDLLPYLGRARLIGESRAGLLVLEGVDLAGEAVFMTTSALAQANQLQLQQVGQMAGMYQQLLELQASTHASDPRLLAMQREFEHAAAEVRGATVAAFAAMIEQRAIFLAAKHVFHGIQRVGAAAASAKVSDDGAAPEAIELAADPRVAQVAPARYEAVPADLAELHAGLRAAGDEVSPIHVDPTTGLVYFELRRGAVVARIEAAFPAAITSSASLVAHANRIVGQPLTSRHDGHEILREANRGHLTALRRLGIDVPPGLTLDGIEFGLGALPDGRFVVVRGEPHAVDWSSLPGVEPIAHTHPLTDGNHPRQIGLDEIALVSTVEVTARPLLGRALVYPSAADIAVMGQRGVHEHLVITNLEVRDGAAGPPTAGGSAPRLEWHILDAVKVGTEPGLGDVYRAHLIGDVGGRPVVQHDVWASAPTDGSAGALFMASPLRAPAAAAPPARTEATRAAVARRQADLTSAVAERLRGAGDGLAIEVLTADEFVARFRSEQGRAVFVLEGDRPKVYARLDATVEQVGHELDHVDQLAGPMGAAIRRLHAGGLDEWDRRSVRDRLELLRTKLAVEIDAAQGRLDSEPAAADGDGEAPAALANLRALQQELDGFTDAEVAEMSAGTRAVPDYLEHPAWLFSKARVVKGHRPGRLDENAPRVILPRTGADRSAAWDTHADVQAVYRIGDEWRDVVHVTADHAGTVAIRDDDAGARTVIITDTAGVAHPYPLEAGAALDVAAGDRVAPGQGLATERHRRYRLVEVEHAVGKERREEILAVTGYWVQRGTESTRRGAIMEAAARLQLDARLAAEGVAKLPATGGDAGYRRINHQRGGGGFDDVVVIFSGTADEPTAFLRIREVKDYANRHVPLEEFSAIRPPGLEKNLETLDLDAQLAARAIADGGEPPPGFEGLSVPQIKALRDAIEARSLRIEVVLGPSTRLGREDAPGASVLRTLRQEIRNALDGADVLARSGAASEADPERVEQSFADAATRAETEKP